VRALIFTLAAAASGLWRRKKMTTALSAHRGSRKHVLDWTGRHDFRTDLAELVALPGLGVREATLKPRGVDAPDEARLEHFGPQVMPAHPA